MSEALINPKILSWARERAGMTGEELAKKLNIKDTNKIVEWEEGSKKPTFIQAQKLADKLHIPFGYLYLEEVPEEELPIPDLRTVRDAKTHQLSPDIFELIDGIRFKQDWYRDYLVEQGVKPLKFAGKYNVDTDYRSIAKDITKVLDLTLEHRKQVSNWEDFLKLLMDKSEEAGIWVMRSGIVGNNTHRPLDVLEFRGLVIYDNITPVVFLNGKDAKAAQIFTLIHELAHIWIGESGISDLSLGTSVEHLHNRIEKLCNKVAAEALVPEEFFRSYWQDINSIDSLARFFRVSPVVIARRAYELKLVGWQEYIDFYRSQQELWKKLAERQKKNPGGQPKYTIPIRYGKHFTNAILISALNGKVMLRDAGRLLGLSPSKLFNLAKDIGVA
ncbi:MAG: XRE family transcriptional regulator [Sulfurovum sp.]|nr:XRE family transcriptional regulator [Sulfurovum sp.]